jgi:hypothetical protein
MWWGYLASAVVSYIPEDSIKNRDLKTLHEKCVDCIRGTGKWQGKTPCSRRLAGKVASGPLGTAILIWFFITVIVLLIVNYNYYLIGYL